MLQFCGVIHNEAYSPFLVSLSRNLLKYKCFTNSLICNGNKKCYFFVPFLFTSIFFQYIIIYISCKCHLLIILNVVIMLFSLSFSLVLGANLEFAMISERNKLDRKLIHTRAINSLFEFKWPLYTITFNLHFYYNSSSCSFSFFSYFSCFSGSMNVRVSSWKSRISSSSSGIANFLQTQLMNFPIVS